MIMLRITLSASARAAASILDFVEGLVKAEADAVRVDAVEPVQDKAKSTKHKAQVLGTPPAVASATAEPLITNPFVASAVEGSGGRVQSRIRPGQNRVVYLPVRPGPDATIVGVPARILRHLEGTPSGMSAKDIEVDLGLRRKSVESALWHLRTIGAVQSVSVTA